MENKTGTVIDAVQQSNEKKNAPRRMRAILPKLLCILAAFVLWIYVMQVESPEYTDTINSIPVKIENSARLQAEEGLSIYSGKDQYVNVSISGKKSIISQLDKDDIVAFIDVGTINDAGRHSLDVYVDLPEGLTLIEPSPATVTVFADQTSTVSLSVKEKLDKLVLPYPYEQGMVDLEYDTITVTGPSNKINSIAGAQVNVNMEGKTSSFSTKAPITLYGINGEEIDPLYITMSVTEMNVTVPIYVTKEIPITTEFKNGRFDPALVTVTCSPETVTVKGDESVFADNSLIADTIFIDASLITDNKYTLKIRPTFNRDVMVDPSDEEVLVTVELDSSLRTKTFNVGTIQVTGASDEIKYKILDSSLAVTLRGEMSQLNEIKSSDISVVVDLSGYDSESSGTVEKNVTIDIDAVNTDSVFALGTYTVKVDIN